MMQTFVVVDGIKSKKKTGSVPTIASKTSSVLATFQWLVTSFEILQFLAKTISQQHLPLFPPQRWCNDCPTVGPVHSNHFFYFSIQDRPQTKIFLSYKRQSICQFALKNVYYNPRVKCQSSSESRKQINMIIVSICFLSQHGNLQNYLAVHFSQHKIDQQLCREIKGE